MLDKFVYFWPKFVKYFCLFCNGYSTQEMEIKLIFLLNEMFFFVLKGSNKCHIEGVKVLKFRSGHRREIAEALGFFMAKCTSS